MKLRFVVSHPFRKEREMDGARRVCGLMSEKQPQVLRLAALAQDDRVFENGSVLFVANCSEQQRVTRKKWQT